MAAKKKPVEQWSLADLELSSDDVTVNQSVSNIGKAEARQAGEVVEDDGSGAARIADFLKEAKVI
jgi:electron transfer flavoprotein beta subunit